MFTQITIIKLNDATGEFKLTFFSETGVAHTERILSITEVLATIRTALTQLHRHPQSSYDKT